MAMLWLECKTEKGMLGGEFAVSVETESGTVSLFLPRDSVRQTQNRSTIRVTLLDENEAFQLVELPQAPIDGSRAVKVKRAQTA